MHAAIAVRSMHDTRVTRVFHVLAYPDRVCPNVDQKTG